MFRFSYAAKVGLIFLVTVFLFFMVLDQLGYTPPWVKAVKGYRIKIVFENIKGLQEGTEVQHNGVRIGEVESIDMHRFGDAEAIIRIFSENDVIHENAYFSIAQSGIFGGSIIFISESKGGKLRSQGKDNENHYIIDMPKGETVLEANVYYDNVVVGKVIDIVQSQDAKFSDDVTIELYHDADIELTDGQAFVASRRRERSVPVLGSLQPTEEVILGRIDIYDRIMPDEEVIGKREPGPEDLIASANNLVNSASQAIYGVSDSLNDLVANVNVALQGLAIEITSSEEGTVKSELVSAISKLRDGLENVEELTDNLNGILLDAKPRIDNIITDIEGATSDIGEATSQVKNIVSDPALNDSLRNAMANIEAATEEVLSTIEEIEELVSDEDTQEDLKAVLSGARETVETASDTLKEAQSTLKSVTETGLSAQFRVRYLTEPEHFASDFEISITPSGRDIFYRTMVEDIGESDDFSFQLGYLGEEGLGAHFGIKRGQVGAGFDYVPGDFFLRGDVYDPNDVQFDVYGGFAISDDFKFIIGFEDLYDENYFHFGIATEF